MSNISRHAWRDQQQVLNERLKGFMQNPGNEQLEAVLAEMHAYADAAKTGAIEIPKQFTAYS